MTQSSDEDELQNRLGEVEVFGEGDDLFHFPGTDEIDEFWQWDHRSPTSALTYRVQERRKRDGQIEQRYKNRYDDGTTSEWSDWYSALKASAIKRTG